VPRFDLNRDFASRRTREQRWLIDLIVARLSYIHAAHPLTCRGNPPLPPPSANSIRGSIAREFIPLDNGVTLRTVIQKRARLMARYNPRALSGKLEYGTSELEHASSDIMRQGSPRRGRDTYQTGEKNVTVIIQSSFSPCRERQDRERGCPFALLTLTALTVFDAIGGQGGVRL